MNAQNVLDILTGLGAVITGSHIVYTSGKHGDSYINKDALYPHTKATWYLCRTIAQQFKNDNVEVVIAPAIGGVILSQWVAYHLTALNQREVLGVYAEKIENGEFVIKRGYDAIVRGKRVLVVEDVLTTGDSAKKVIEASRALDAKIIGLGVICNRGGIKRRDVANPPIIFSLLNLNLDSFDKKNCPLCARGIPINTSVGKGREYLARKNAS